MLELFRNKFALKYNFPGLDVHDIFLISTEFLPRPEPCVDPAPLHSVYIPKASDSSNDPSRNCKKVIRCCDAFRQYIPHSITTCYWCTETAPKTTHGRPWRRLNLHPYLISHVKFGRAIPERSTDWEPEQKLAYWHWWHRIHPIPPPAAWHQSNREELHLLRCTCMTHLSQVSLGISLVQLRTWGISGTEGMTDNDH